MLPKLLIVIAACIGFIAQTSAQVDHQSERFTTESRVYLSSGPAVVNIGVYEIFPDNFGLAARNQQLGQGTGVIIDNRGLVITNAHVVNQSARNRGAIVYRLTFAEQFGGHSVTARLLTTDKDSDLALLKIIEEGNYTPIVFAKEDDLMIGEKVIAIGSPLGNSHSLTSGILSGVNRDIDVSVGRSDTVKFEGLIQTDAAINFGNSGGPLLNSLGELIGINNATAQSADGIGYAIPIKQVNKILKDELRLPQIWFGATLKSDTDLSIEQLHPRSPAASQGLLINDSITAVNGVVVANNDELNNELIVIPADSAFDLEILREQRILTISLALPAIAKKDTIGLLGLEGVPSSVVYIDENRMRRRNNVIEVTTVLPDSPAAALGVKIGDNIHAIRVQPSRYRTGWKPVSSMATLVSNIKGQEFIKTENNIVWSTPDGSYHQGKLILD